MAEQPEREEMIAEAVLQQDELSVERVPLGVPVDVAPPVREEGDVLIVPVLEEQLVIQTRLILKEELRITRHRRSETFREPVRLRAERVEVAREGGRDPADTPDSEGHPS
jgi:stress response protein YsnF